MLHLDSVVTTIMVSLANCCGEHRCSHGYRGHRARDQHAALLRLRAMDVWRPTVKLGRCPGGILIRCLNHLNWLLSTQRSSSSTPSPSQMAELLTLKIGHPCFFEWDTDFWQCLPAVSRWASQIRLRFLTSFPNHLNIPTHHPIPSLHTYSVSTHRLQHYILWDLPLCYESTMLEPNTKLLLLLAVKTSTQHSIVSQPQRTEEWHGFNLFLKAMSRVQLAKTVCVC